MPNPLTYIKTVLSQVVSNKNTSLGISDSEVIKNVSQDPNFPFMMSFSRTGSHWLRMVMELYFEKPSLVRVFYYKDCQDYLTLHTHDLKLDIYRNNVIYLYRDPVPTIYSQMMYHQEDINNQERISYWAMLYGKHLAKWLIEETVSEKKTIIRYENMIKDFLSEFSKITTHFELSLDSNKLQQAIGQVSKDEVKKKTIHDKQVIKKGYLYESKRQQFTDQYSKLINNLVIQQNSKLDNYIN